RDEVLVIMVEERAAARAATERPAEAVLHLARTELTRRDLPDLLEANAEFLRVAALVQLVAGDDLLGERATGALAEQRIFTAQLHPAGEIPGRLAVAAD